MLSYNNVVIQRDLEEILQEKYNWNKFRNKTILITGANGMLASYFIYTLFQLNKFFNYKINIIALVRNIDTAKKLFQDDFNEEYFSILHQDVCDPINFEGELDYIVHAAGLANPYAMVNQPVEIVKANVLGTVNILELARAKNIDKILFTSTREVYGEVREKVLLTESDFGILDPLSNRACYPESKRMAETILKSYELQYGINFNTVRIAHTYGPGMKLNNDGRIMADLLSDVINTRNIILKSTGEAIRAFCYISDAIKALFLVLLEGEKGAAYNVANEKEPISIKNLAELLVEIFPKKQIELEYSLEEENKGYTNYLRVALDTNKIEKLGWDADICLEEGIRRTIESFEV